MSQVCFSDHAISRATERGIDLGVITYAVSGVHLFWDRNGPFRAHFRFAAGFDSTATLLTVVRPFAAACGSAAAAPDDCVLPELAQALAAVGLGGIADMICAPPQPGAGAGQHSSGDAERGTVPGQYRDCADAIYVAAPPIMCGRQQQRREPDVRVAPLYRAALAVRRAYLALGLAMSPVLVWSSDLAPGETRAQAADRIRRQHSERAQLWWGDAQRHVADFWAQERIRLA